MMLQAFHHIYLRLGVMNKGTAELDPAAIKIIEALYLSRLLVGCASHIENN